MLNGFLFCCLAIGSGYMTGHNYNINLTVNNITIDEDSILHYDYSVDYYDFDLGITNLSFYTSDFIQNVSLLTHELEFEVVVNSVSLSLDSSNYIAYLDLDLDFYFIAYRLDYESDSFHKNITTVLSVPYRAGSTVEMVYTRYICHRAGSAYFYDYELIYWEGYHNGSDDAVALYNADWLGWIGKTLSSIMDIELFMGFTLGGIFGTCVIVAIAIWFLKMFTGG